MAADIRKMVRGGLDPVKERGLKAERAPIFAQVTRECYGAMKGGWKNGEHESWLPSFENHVFPIIGRMPIRSEEHTSELQSLMRISYAVFCLTKKKTKKSCSILKIRHKYLYH